MYSGVGRRSRKDNQPDEDKNSSYQGRKSRSSAIYISDDGSLSQAPMPYLQPNDNSPRKKETSEVTGSKLLEQLYDDFYKVESENDKHCQISEAFQAFLLDYQKNSQYDQSLIVDICMSFFNQLKKEGHLKTAGIFLSYMKETKYYDILNKHIQELQKKNNVKAEVGLNQQIRPFFNDLDYMTNENTIEIATPDMNNNRILIRIKVLLASVEPNVKKLVVYPFGPTNNLPELKNIRLKAQLINFRFTDDNGVMGKVKGELDMTKKESTYPNTYVFILKKWFQEDKSKPDSEHKADFTVINIDPAKLVLPIRLNFNGHLLF